MKKSARSLLLEALDATTGSDDERAYEAYRHDPVAFFEYALGWKPWQKQAEVAEALMNDQRVSVVSCNGAGKTTLGARILLWFLCTRRDAVIVTTAPTWHQVGLLWREVRTAYRTALRPLPGNLMATRLEVGPTWYAMGLSTDREERFQGFHAKGMNKGEDGGLLVIVDEASGVEDPIFDAMRGYLTSKNCYVLLQGNGNRSEGAFYESHQRGPWSRFSISAHDVPEEIISREWITEQAEYWTEESDQYLVRVLGGFPKGGGDFQLVPTWLLEATKDLDTKDDSGLHMGVDVARAGSDRTVVVITKDNKVIKTDAWQSNDLTVTAKRVAGIAELHEIEGDHIHVDVAGLGAGVVDNLRAAGFAVDAVDFGGKPLHDWDWLIGSHVKCLNRKAELHWAARMALMKEHASVPEEHKDTVWRQIGWINYQFNEKGSLKIESKDKLREKHGQSPDYADAWVISLSRILASRRIFVV